MARPLSQAQHGGAGRVCKHSDLLNRESTTQPNGTHQPICGAQRSKFGCMPGLGGLWFAALPLLSKDKGLGNGFVRSDQFRNVLFACILDVDHPPQNITSLDPAIDFA
jgi:hypothetical protein